MTAWLMMASLAFAQDGFNAHGLAWTPDDGDPGQAMGLWRPARQVGGMVGLSVLSDYAYRPLVYEDSVTGDVTEGIEHLVAMNFGAHVGFHERVSLALAAPMYLYTDGINGGQGPAMGDLRLSLPVGLVLPKTDGTGFGLNLVGFMDLPSGQPERFSGDLTFGGGGILGLSYGLKRFAITANFGARATAPSDHLNVQRHIWVLPGIDLGIGLTEKVWLHIQGEMEASVNASEPYGTSSPGEVALVARGLAAKDRLAWLVGASAGVTPGASAASVRGFVGIQGRFGKQQTLEPNCDVAQSVVHVVDPEGRSVPGATVAWGPTTYTADAYGLMTLPKEAQNLTVDAPEGAPLQAVAYEHTGAETGQVTLPYAPGTVNVQVRNESGEPVAAKVFFDGEPGREEHPIDGDGTWTLTPGDWAVMVEAEGYGLERKDVNLPPAGTEAVDVFFTVAPARVAQVDDEFVLLEGIEFAFDKHEVHEVSMQILEEVATALHRYDHIDKVVVQGHTDSRGSHSYNRELSQRRVDEVMRHLVDLGIHPDRIEAQGHGEGCPIATNGHDDGRAQNRRVQFFIVDPENPNSVPCTNGNEARAADVHQVR